MGQAGRMGFHGTSGDRQRGGKDTGAAKPLERNGGHGDTPRPNSRDRLEGTPGEVKVTTYYGYRQETLIGPDKKAVVERHHSDHDRPEIHSNPHDHKITWHIRKRDGKDCPLFDEPANYRDGDRIPKLEEYLP